FFALWHEDRVDALGLLEELLDVGGTRCRGARLAGAREDLDHLPVLRRAERAALLDAHEVTGLHVAGGVVGRVLLAQADDLLVERVLAHALDDHRHGVRLLRRAHDADPGAAARPAPRVRRGIRDRALGDRGTAERTGALDRRRGRGLRGSGGRGL